MTLDQANEIRSTAALKGIDVEITNFPSRSGVNFYCTIGDDENGYTSDSYVFVLQYISEQN